MKIKKPSTKTATNAAVNVGGFVAGSFVGNVVMDAIHKPTAGADSATAKKENTMALVKRGGLIAAGIIGAAAIDGNDTVSQLAKAALTGLAGSQALSLVSESVKNSTALAADTKVNRAIKTGLGLACPCGESGLNGRRRRRGLKEPFYYEQAPVAQFEQPQLNAFELAYISGRDNAA